MRSTLLWLTLIAGALCSDSDDDSLPDELSLDGLQIGGQDSASSQRTIVPVKRSASPEPSTPTVSNAPTPTVPDPPTSIPSEPPTPMEEPRRTESPAPESWRARSPAGGWRPRDNSPRSLRSLLGRSLSGRERDGSWMDRLYELCDVQMLLLEHFNAIPANNFRNIIEVGEYKKYRRFYSMIRDEWRRAERADLDCIAQLDAIKRITGELERARNSFTRRSEHIKTAARNRLVDKVCHNQESLTAWMPQLRQICSDVYVAESKSKVRTMRVRDKNSVSSINSQSLRRTGSSATLRRTSTMETLRRTSSTDTLQRTGSNETIRRVSVYQNIGSSDNRHRSSQTQRKTSSVDLRKNSSSSEDTQRTLRNTDTAQRGGANQSSRRNHPEHRTRNNNRTDNDKTSTSRRTVTRRSSPDQKKANTSSPSQKTNTNKTSPKTTSKKNHRATTSRKNSTTRKTDNVVRLVPLKHLSSRRSKN